MTRARSGSFYCPVEPAWAPLSLSQKAALSTANCANPKSASAPAIRARRHVQEADIVDAGADSIRATAASQPTTSGAASQCPIPVANPNPSTVDKDSDLDSDSESSPLPSPRQRPYTHTHSRSLPFASPATAASTATASMTYANANAVFARRHAYSPRQPSPLRRQANEKGVCPSALWTTHTDLLAIYGSSQPQQPQYQPRKRHSRSASAPNAMLRSVLKNGFLAGPMAEKARMYGLRVAWCVFGDVKDIIGRDLFAGRRPPHRSSHSVDSAGFARAADVDSLSTLPSLPTVPSVPSVALAPRASKRQSYPTNSASLTFLNSSSTVSTSSRLRRSPSSLVIDTDPIDPIHLDDGDEADADAVVLEHSENVQLTIDEKVAQWEQEVHRRALENPLDGDSSSSSSSSSYEDEEPSTRLFRLSGDEDSNEDSDESDSIYDECSDEEMHFISDGDSDSDSDSSESAESLDDEAEVERDVFSILERTILGFNTINADIDRNSNGISNSHSQIDRNIDRNSNSKGAIEVNVSVNVDVRVEVDVNPPEVTVGSPPTPWELPFVGFVGDL